MNHLLRIAAALWLLALLHTASAADIDATRIDRLFSAWDKDDTPGLSLAVIRDGRIVYSRGYGLANLEYGVRNTPSTVFHVASVSKQFTALAIHLLAQDGKLALDDDVRKYIPELQVQAAPITIRHLLHHTSGLRDQWSLLTLAGLRMDDVITEGDILGLLWQQRDLNFPPGTEELYSNSGFTLLGLVVKRVSGQSLDAFAQSRMFGPLGMKDTHFQESYGRLVKNRAYSYVKTRDGYRLIALSYSNVGATSLMTTVEDLARWDRNFQDMQVGGAPVMAAMHAPGVLDSGRATTYASGLFLGHYRGLPIVEHGGVDAGFRAHLLRFPQQHVSVALLGNAADLKTGDLTRRVADIVLEGLPALDAPQGVPAEIEVRGPALRPYLGDFEMSSGLRLRFTTQGNRLMVQATGQQKYPMFASAADSFFAKAFEASVTFDAPLVKGLAVSATWRQREQNHRLTRLADQPAPLPACTGDFYSSELRTVYTLSSREGRLMLRYPRGELELTPFTNDAFNAPYPIGSLQILRNAAGACEGFAVNTGRVRKLRFMKVSLAPAS